MSLKSTYLSMVIVTTIISVILLGSLYIELYNICKVDLVSGTLQEQALCIFFIAITMALTCIAGSMHIESFQKYMELTSRK